MLMLIALVVAAPDREPAGPTKKAVNEQIFGDWRCIKVDVTDVTKQAPMVFRVTPTETVFLMNGQPSVGDGLTATYAIDWTKDPVAISLMPRRGGPALLGILKLEGDRLTLGLKNNGQAGRPTQFADASLVLVYERARP
jgi:uncharacterized protein (TIGR03067 family)